MGEVLAFLLVAGCLAGILGGLAWLGSRVRRRGAGGEVMGPFEEIWHPAANRSRIEIRVQEERVAPMPSPGDLGDRRRGDAGQRGTEPFSPG